MNVAAIISAVASAMSLAQQLVDLGRDVSPILSRAGELLLKGDLATEDDVVALQAMSDAYAAEIEATELPPEEG